jgi:sn-glycerol 3-phosphate transport system substrate-binding protein
MTGGLNEWVNDMAKQFNASQTAYKVVPTFKGSYAESMTAGITAFRSGNAPHILQVFEVGTATMMYKKIRPIQHDARGREKFDPKIYLPAVAGYYTDKGECCRSRSTARRPSSTTTRTCSRRRASTRTARR